MMICLEDTFGDRNEANVAVVMAMLAMVTMVAKTTNSAIVY